MKNFGLWLLVTGAMVVGVPARAADETPKFESCNPFVRFANCTKAVCDPNTYECACFLDNNVKSGVSVPPGCSPPSTATVQSHYSPVPATGLCGSQTTKWAQCLGVTCSITDKGVICPCKATNSQNSGGGPYVIVTNDRYQGQCTDGKLYSSATYNAEVKSISEALHYIMPTVTWEEK